MTETLHDLTTQELIVLRNRTERLAAEAQQKHTNWSLTNEDVLTEAWENEMRNYEQRLALINEELIKRGVASNE